jgi:hypothetical protein
LTSIFSLKREVAIISKALSSNQDVNKSSEVTQALLWVNEALINYSRAVTTDSGEGNYNCPEALATQAELTRAIANYEKVNPEGNLFSNEHSDGSISEEESEWIIANKGKWVNRVWVPGLSQKMTYREYLSTQSLGK